MAQIHAQENDRLERGLLPSPLLADPRLSVSARCLAGGQQRLLGGDFYDVVEVPDGWVHALIGDVCGRGPAEAALGVCLRVAWRTLVLARRPAGEILSTLGRLLEHERQDDTMFATLCMMSVAPDRRTGWIRMAGHLPPVLVVHSGVRELDTLSAPQELSATQAANATPLAHAEELQRSNSELEQFAYIASHDLQEPLRKVASFSQLLQRRYAGQLDARADQYIEFAVDGAKRMQVLINDLLAYSRVGRSAREPALVSSDAALAQARANLATSIEESGATMETGHLPLVLAELPLLTAVFQNLLSNALKFSGEKPPRVVITASRDEPFWLFSFSDNGIGIEPEYAERIFVIFQRLHERTAYAGTGIGLAMTRKIIEYFGGRIWLDTEYSGGARFLFTLPMPEEDLTQPGPGALEAAQAQPAVEPAESEDGEDHA